MPLEPAPHCVVTAYCVRGRGLLVALGVERNICLVADMFIDSVSVMFSKPSRCLSKAGVLRMLQGMAIWVLLTRPAHSGGACTRSKVHPVMALPSSFGAGRCKSSTFHDAVHEVVSRDKARAAVASCTVFFPCLVAQACTGSRSRHQGV